MEIYENLRPALETWARMEHAAEATVEPTAETTVEQNIARYLSLAAEIKRLSAEQDELKTAISAAMGTARGGIAGNSGRPGHGHRADTYRVVGRQSAGHPVPRRSRTGGTAHQFPQRDLPRRNGADHRQQIGRGNMDEGNGYSGMFYVMLVLGIVGVVGMLAMTVVAGGGL